MLNTDTIDVASIRNQVERAKNSILDQSDKARAKTLAQQLAQSMYELTGLSAVPDAQKIQLPGAAKWTMNGDVPVAVHVSEEESQSQFIAFLEKIDKQLAWLEDFKQQVEANKALDWDDSRQLVLQTVAQLDRDKHGFDMWGGEIQARAMLTPHQMSDALVHWDHAGVLDVDHQVYLGGDETWRVKLTPHGRSVAAGKTPKPQPLAMIFQNSNIGVVGHNYGNVTQNIGATFPQVPDDIRRALVETPQGDALLDSLDEEVAKAQPRPATIKKLLGGIRSTVDAANWATETMDHAHEWLDSALDWLAPFLGG